MATATAIAAASRSAEGVDKAAGGPYITRAALLVGPGRGWSGFIATSAASGAPFTLASGGEPPRRTCRALVCTRGPPSYDVFFSCASNEVRIRAYCSSAFTNSFMYSCSVSFCCFQSLLNIVRLPATSYVSNG